MKMNRKGFTLIELLAVIVILAIIALIATPLILGVIDEAKKGAARSSAYGYAKAIEHHLLIEAMDNTTVDLSNDNFTDATIEVNGTKPTIVDVSVYNGAVVGGFMVVDGYKLTFGSNGAITTTEVYSE